MTASDDNDSDAPVRHDRRRFEVFLALGLIAFGFVVLPALIYVTGMILLGAYGGGEHIGSFYGDYARDLGDGSARAWTLVLGPYLLVQLARLIFFRFGAAPGEPVTSRPPAGNAIPRSDSKPRERREPTLKL